MLVLVAAAVDDTVPAVGDLAWLVVWMARRDKRHCMQLLLRVIWM